MTVTQALKAYANVCRMEYIQLEGPGVVVPLFLAATSVGGLLTIQVAEALTVFMLMFFSGFMANSLTDVEVDSRFKTYISDAVRALGEKTLIVLIVVHVSLGMLLTLHLSVAFGNYWLLLWVALAAFFGLAYSLPPFQFKVRGPMYFSLQIGSFIMLSLVYYAIGGRYPPVPVVFIFVSFLVVHVGIELVNQAQDYVDDKECGLRTPAVRWGVTPTLIAAFVVTFVGLTLGAVGFYIFYRTLPDIEILGVTLGFRALYVFTVVAFVAGYSPPLIGTWRFIKMSRQESSPQRTVARIKKELNYARWQVTGVVSVTVATTVYFIWKLNCD